GLLSACRALLRHPAPSQAGFRDDRERKAGPRRVFALRRFGGAAPPLPFARRTRGRDAARNSTRHSLGLLEQLISHPPSLRGARRRSNPGFLRAQISGLLPWSLSSGAHSRDPLARDDEDVLVTRSPSDAALCRRSLPERGLPTARRGAA